MGIFNRVCVCVCVCVRVCVCVSVHGCGPAVKGHGYTCGTLMLLLRQKECFWQDWFNESWRMSGQGSNHCADSSCIYSEHTHTHTHTQTHTHTHTHTHSTAANLSGIYRQQDAHGCALALGMKHSIALWSTTTEVPHNDIINGGSHLMALGPQTCCCGRPRAYEWTQQLNMDTFQMEKYTITQSENCILLCCINMETYSGHTWMWKVSGLPLGIL